LGLRPLPCQCKATATGSRPDSEATIDGQSAAGALTVSASICPNCTTSQSFINIQWIDNNNPNNSFTATFNQFDIPECPNQFDLTVSGTGTASGVNFNGPATLNFIAFSDQVPPGLIIDIDLTANGHSFEQQGGIIGTVSVESC
jgi:hypothetical protein